MTAERISTPSQAILAPGSQETSPFVPENSEITSQHINDLYEWQDGVFPHGEPLARQYSQYAQEAGEVGEEVFGLSDSELDNMSLPKRNRTAAEITDQIIAGLGTLKVLDEDYDKLRKRKEKAIYDSSTVTEHERWQIDANGQERTVHERFADYRASTMKTQWLAEKFGSRDKKAEDLSPKQRRRLSNRIADSITSALSVLNGLGESFSAHFDGAYKIMNIKYNKRLIQELRDQGLDDAQVMAEAKRIHNERKFAEKSISRDGEDPIVVFAPQEVIFAA